MVKTGHDKVPLVSYNPPAGDAGGLEVLSLTELANRMRRRPGMQRTQRIDFHQLFTVRRGTIAHMVDFTEYTLCPGSWLWVRPGQIQEFGDLAAGSGWVVLFQAGFLDGTTAAATGLDDPAGHAHWRPDGNRTAGAAAALEHLAREFHSEFGPADTVRARILQHLLAVTMLRLTHHTDPANSAATISGETFLRFRSAVEEQFADTRHVGDYAGKLGYSARSITRATRAATGMGAKAFIDQRVLLEAKRLLAHEPEPVSAIAHRLGFDDASNFVKYFTHHTGATPASFRRAYRS